MDEDRTAKVQAYRRLSAADVAAVHALVEQAETTDSAAPLSEHVLLHLPSGGDEHGRNLLVRDAEDVVAYAHLDITDEVDGASAELVVAPDVRQRGLGRALVRAVLAAAPDGRLRLWAHGDSPAAASLAAALDFRRSRVLLQMRRSLVPGSVPLPPVSLREGVTVRAFVPGQDEQAWTAVNNRAFADHPDQGGWGVQEVELREKEPWFDPAGFFLAEAGGELVGFHWTKVHGGDHPHHDHPPIGEVYIVGVDPSAQGQRLGPALTLVGLHHLQQQGLAEVLLYVDESNEAAVRVYERLGFTRHATDVMYAHP